MNSRTPFVWILLTVFLLMTGSQEIAMLATDWMWFTALDFEQVFLTTIGVQAACFVAGAVLVGGAVWWSGIRAVRATRNRPVVLSPELEGSALAMWANSPQALEGTVRVVAVLVALLAGGAARVAWDDVLAFLHATDMGYADPILGLDAGFYVFTYPLIRVVQGLAGGAVFLSLLIAVAIYSLRGAIGIRSGPGEEGASLRADPGPRRHLALLAAGMLLVFAVGFHLQRFDVMFGRGGLFDGPGYTEVHAVLPLLTVQAVATAIASFLVFQAIDQLRGGSFLGAMLLLASSTLASAFIPGTVQQLVVLPNEVDKESVYISEHVQASRAAWGLTDVEERKLSGSAELTYDDIEANRPTVQNIRLWDHGPLLKTFRQVQEIRTYYDFSGVDNDRYVIDGELRQTMISARELISDALPDQARTWVNESLVYTHGYGVTLGPVNAVTEQGLPHLFVKDLPPAVTHPDPLAIDEPAVYYGERMPRPVFVRTRAKEFDFPTAEGNAYSTYTGAGGVPLGNMLRRALVALRLNSLKVILSDDLSDGSRVLLYRQVRQRVQRIAPFLAFDADPYLVIADGRLVWVVEAYTHTDNHPYAAHRTVPGGRGQPANYVRNSVKVTVDAYDGTPTFYLVDDTDPLAEAWSMAYPGLFTPAEEMPASLRDHLRYPMALFERQAELFATLHMTDSQVFYNREDEWEIPSGAEGRMRPYYTVMKLPGEDTEEFILMLPFTPREKDNLAAWMVARSDGDQYGGLRVYRFPKDRLVYGPSQVIARIRQDDQISEKLTLWNQQTSEARMGTLLVIPVEESLLYVQPLYLLASDDAIPELKRVIVGYEDNIAMKPTLEEGLRELFGEAPLAEPPPDDGTFTDAEGQDLSGVWQDLAVQAADLFRSAEEAAAEGRWADFGSTLDALGSRVRKLEALGKGDPVDEVLGEGPVPDVLEAGADEAEGVEPMESVDEADAPETGEGPAPE